MYAVQNYSVYSCIDNLAFYFSSTKYGLEAKTRNLRNYESEASVASGGFLIAKIS